MANGGLFTFATRVLKPDCLAIPVTPLTQNHSFFIKLFLHSILSYPSEKANTQ